MVTKIVIRRNKIYNVQLVILGEPTPGTWGSHQLLIKQYKTLELPPEIIGEPPMKHDSASSKKWWMKGKAFKQMQFNENWMRSILAKYGELHCEFCGKPNLRIVHHTENQKKGQKLMATVDHWLPKADNPHLAFTVENFRLACYQCNNNKKKHIYTRDMLRFEYPEPNRVY